MPGRHHLRRRRSRTPLQLRLRILQRRTFTLSPGTPQPSSSCRSARHHYQAGTGPDSHDRSPPQRPTLCRSGAGCPRHRTRPRTPSTRRPLHPENLALHHDCCPTDPGDHLQPLAVLGHEDRSCPHHRGNSAGSAEARLIGKGPHRCGPSCCCQLVTLILPSSASAATTAGMATTVTSSRAAARAASAPAPPAIAVAIATTAARTSFTCTFRPRRACLYRGDYSIYTVEVRFIIRVEIRAAFDHRRRGSLRSAVRRRWRYRARCLIAFWRRRSPAHLGSLLFQNCLPRQLDAVAFDGQNFHQYLVAFFQFIANVFDSVFGDFTDVQQSIQARQNFDERAKIRPAADLDEIGLPYLGRR